MYYDSVADELTPIDSLVYRSNILGADQRITNTGGGNTSAKLIETDPLTGEEVEVLWVKGSGGDLRTAKKENFSSSILRLTGPSLGKYHKEDAVKGKDENNSF